MLSLKISFLISDPTLSVNFFVKTGKKNVQAAYFKEVWILPKPLPLVEKIFLFLKAFLINLIFRKDLGN